ncbi:serine palmitoyltransferase small subunit B [Pimephales promelas]|nr:serine palmitoyltransferase small subunit B [Pimephales promelas]
MGDKSAVHQQKQPPYDGLCNYAQKITSCFGLDGKHRPSVFFYVIYVFISIGGSGALCLRLVRLCSLFCFVRELSLMCALELDQFPRAEIKVWSNLRGYRLLKIGKFNAYKNYSRVLDVTNPHICINPPSGICRKGMAIFLRLVECVVFTQLSDIFQNLHEFNTGFNKKHEAVPTLKPEVAVVGPQPVSLFRVLIRRRQAHEAPCLSSSEDTRSHNQNEDRRDVVLLLFTDDEWKENFGRGGVALHMEMKKMRENMGWLYYQYLLMTGIYVLEPWEKSVFNTVLCTLMAMVIYTTYVFVPVHVCLGLEFFSALVRGQPESTVALMN